MLARGRDKTQAPARQITKSQQANHKTIPKHWQHNNTNKQADAATCQAERHALLFSWLCDACVIFSRSGCMRRVTSISHCVYKAALYTKLLFSAVLLQQKLLSSAVLLQQTKVKLYMRSLQSSPRRAAVVGAAGCCGCCAVTRVAHIAIANPNESAASFVHAARRAGPMCWPGCLGSGSCFGVFFLLPLHCRRETRTT